MGERKKAKLYNEVENIDKWEGKFNVKWKWMKQLNKHQQVNSGEKFSQMTLPSQAIFFFQIAAF